MSRKPTTERFTGRASYYARYRPSYPRRLVDDLFTRGVIPQGGKVADLGSGTGIFSELLLERGLTVYAVEPNDDMRRTAEERLSGRKGFVSVRGLAESTGLRDHSVDVATAAQAYHWFEPIATRKELRRILVPPCWVVLLWNERQVEADEFSIRYEELVNEFSAEHAGIERNKEDPERIFGDSPLERLTYQNNRELDLEGLKGMAASVSYLPAPGHAGHEEFCSRLEDLFARSESGGMVTVRLRTECCFGHLG
ncbi:MAG: class I SAM-dependent methyltransferase [Methanomassiliicoccales archaeon]|nr:class I SAM-dependent methyltransferase [Methanomassiliicoccales archaeon]